MGDRIIVTATDGRKYTPSFYGHWCGLRAIKVMNDLVREDKSNDINNLMCNFVVTVMGGETQQYSYYLHNLGELHRIADGDNYEWLINTATRTWTTTDPEFRDMTLTLDEADDHVRKTRPCLYRECKCSDYGKNGCTCAFLESQNNKK
ncbi:MAG: hypothetical protein MJZ21_04980 [archaeon]|nr:hypothetical protein [archaeon]